MFINYRIILLTKSKFTIVDTKDYGYLSQFKWHFGIKSKYGHGYAQRRKSVKEGGKIISMHSEILITDQEGDHIDGNTLDNRRKNLRPASRLQQMQNTRSRIGSTSKYVGVHLHKLTGKWRSQMRVNGKRIDLGLFSTPEEARDIRLKYIENNELERFRR